MAAALLHSLNILTYGHGIYQFYSNKDLSLWQKFWGTLPRAVGIVVDGSILGKIGDRNSLKTISPHISGVALSLLDVVAKEEPYENACCTAASNWARLHADPDNAMLISLLMDKMPIVKETIYNYSKSITISLSHPKEAPERIQEEKAEFLKVLKTQENQLGFIEQTMQDYQNIINNATAESFGSIPYCYMNRPEFTKRKCRISKEPIREAVVVREINLPIYYECDNLSGWYKHKRATPLPPSWPKSIPFNRDVIVVDKAETAQITQDLQKALDQTQNDPEELETMKIGFLAMQEVLKDLTSCK